MKYTTALLTIEMACCLGNLSVQNTKPMAMYQTLEGDITSWEERRLAAGFVYQYQIKAALKGDVQTQISKVI
jgi:hypothetical protein